jgi:hypothetical protein
MQQISIDNIDTASVSTVFVTTAAGLAPVKITTVYVTDSSYNNTTATAVSTAGGYIKIIGSGFIAGCQVLVNYSPATSTTFISSSELRVQISATAAGTYVLYVVNTDGGTAIRVNGITFSSVPTWATSSTLTEGAANTAISIQLSASSDSTTTFSVASGSTLPPGLALSTSGLLSGTVTGISVATLYSFTVVATDSELQTNPRTFNITIQFGEPYFAYTTVLLSGDGTNAAQNNTFLDSSTNNFAITRAGNTTQGSFSPYNSYWSLYTNGTSSYAYLPYSATRAIGTGDFSIECWIFIVKQPANFTRVWSHQSNWGLAGSIGVELAFGTVDTLIQTLVDGNSTTYTSATYDTTGTNGSGHVRQWIHVVSSRQNGYLRLFVNGILREAQLSSTNINGTSNTSFGTNSQLGGDLTEMYISNFRMCIGAVPTLYSTTSTTGGTTIFTPPITRLTTTSQGASGVQLLLFQDGRIIDRSSNAFAVTTVSNPTIQHFNPFGNGKIPYTAGTIGGSAYFDGTGDYLSATANSAFALGAGDFTVECWFYLNNTATAMCMFENRPSNTATGINIFVNYSAAGQVQYRDSTGAPISSSITVTAASWNHYALVRSGSTITLWINGQSGGTVTKTTTFTDTTCVLAQDQGGGFNFAGYLSNFRIVKGTAVYTSAFTPSTTPLTAIANTSILTSFVNAGIIDSTMTNNLETASGAKISTAQSKFGGSSIAFNGTTDYCFLPAGHSFLFSKADFTIEAWVYIGDTSARKYVSGPGTDTASHYKGFGLEIWGQQVCMWASSNGTSWDILECDTAGNRGNILLSANTWYHIAVTRSGSTFRSFVNGVVDRTFTSSAIIFTDATIPYNIGRIAYLSGTFFFNGYMDDYRVTKGYARYTAAFTPPTSAAIGS